MGTRVPGLRSLRGRAPSVCAALLVAVIAPASASAQPASPGVPSSGGSAAKPAPAPEPSDASIEIPDAVEPWYRVRAVAELGFLAVLSHRIQFGKGGTYFDYTSEGGQDTLFSVTRFSVEAELWRRHQLVFLYQPLEITTSVSLRRDVRVDDITFPAGTPVDLRYGFPFYRLSYAYDLARSPRHELSLGLSLQIRNASIDFASRDGALLRSNRGVGPVPLLRSRGRYGFSSGAFIGYEVDGIYAPIRGVNGSDNEVTGALVDASVRAGVALPLHSEAFVNIRYLAGGAVGQSDPEPPRDGYTRNWLQFLTVSLGASIASL